MSKRAAAAHPKGVLIELFGDPLGFERVLAQKQRLENLETRLDQPSVGEDAAVPSDAGVSVNGDQRVDRVFRFDLRRPAAFRAFAPPGHRRDVYNLNRGASLDAVTVGTLFRRSRGHSGRLLCFGEERSLATQISVGDVYRFSAAVRSVDQGASGFILARFGRKG